jgi:DNA-binding transcriptional LysR family regulator
VADNLIETIRDLEVFAKVFQHLDTWPKTSYADIARRLGPPHTAQSISASIERLENQMGNRLGRQVVLVDRIPKSGQNTLTTTAHEVFKEVGPALNSLRTWPAPRVEILRIGVSNMIMNSIVPTVINKFREDDPENVAIEVIEYDDLEELAKKLDIGEVDFGLGWIYEEKQVQVDRLRLKAEPFRAAFDVVMVCPPDHPFVSEALNSPRDEPWRLNLKRLDRELVYTVPEDRQPLFEDLPPPAGENLRITLGTFMGVTAMIRGQRTKGRKGLGLLPAIVPELDELRRKGHLFYTPIMPVKEGETEGPKVKIACISRRGRAHMKLSAERFCKIAETTVRSISRLDISQIELEPIPRRLQDYRKFIHCLFVIQRKPNFGVPEWCRGELEWGEPGREEFRDAMEGKFSVVTPLLHDHDHPHRWDFRAVGRLLEAESASKDPRGQARIFLFEGYGNILNHPKHNNMIVCTFNVALAKHDGVIVGVWSGRDDAGLPTSAPMILSREKFDDLNAARAIIHKASFRFLPNAEILYPSESPGDGSDE